MNTTEKQNEVIAVLERKGFRFNDARLFEGELSDTVFMSKRVKFQTFYAEIGPDASVNGQSVKDFLASLS